MSTPAHLKLALNAADAGDLVGGISETSIRRLVEQGHLARVPHTDRLLIARIELERWVASGRPGEGSAA